MIPEDKKLFDAVGDSFIRQLELLIRGWNETIREAKILSNHFLTFQRQIDRIEDKLDIIGANMHTRIWEEIE